MILYIFIGSVFIYFHKYGWFFDKERTAINEKTLKNLGYKKV